MKLDEFLSKADSYNGKYITFICSFGKVYGQFNGSADSLIELTDAETGEGLCIIKHKKYTIFHEQIYDIYVE